MAEYLPHVGTCHMPTPHRPLSRFHHLQHHSLLVPKHPTPWTSNEGSGCRWCLVAHKDGYRSKHTVGHPDRSGEGAAELVLCLDHSHGSKRQGITASTCLLPVTARRAKKRRATPALKTKSWPCERVTNIPISGTENAADIG